MNFIRNYLFCFIRQNTMQVLVYTSGRCISHITIATITIREIIRLYPVLLKITLDNNSLGVYCIP